MKKVSKILMSIAAIAVIAFMACNKEGIKENTSGVTTPSTNISSRGGEATTDQAAAGEAYKADIVLWKGKIDAWRAGTSSTETMEATAAVEKLEAVFNYYLCDAAKSYNDDQTVNATIEVSGTSPTWNAAKIAATVETIKAKVVEVYGTLQGPQKGIRLIDLGTPEVKNGNIHFHISINMGSELFVRGEMPPSSAAAGKVKWGDVDPKVDDPNNIIPCLGSSNVLIGTAVNKKIGYFLGNKAFNPNFPPPNKGAVVLSDIVITITVKDAAQSTGIKALFVNNTLDYEDLSALPPYEKKGKYGFHCDVPSDLSQVCFIQDKIDNYALSNFDIATNNPDFLPRVRAFSTNRSRHQLVATSVQSNYANFSFNGSSPNITREHPTIHYYAAVNQIVDKGNLPPPLGF